MKYGYVTKNIVDVLDDLRVFCCLLTAITRLVQEDGPQGNLTKEAYKRLIDRLDDITDELRREVENLGGLERRNQSGETPK